MAVLWLVVLISGPSGAMLGPLLLRQRTLINATLSAVLVLMGAVWAVAGLFGLLGTGNQAALIIAMFAAMAVMDIGRTRLHHRGTLGRPKIAPPMNHSGEHQAPWER